MQDLELLLMPTNRDSNCVSIPRSDVYIMVCEAYGDIVDDVVRSPLAVESPVSLTTMTIGTCEIFRYQGMPTNW